MRVVVTRPQNRAQATVDRLRAMGHEPLLLPLSEARHLPEQAARALSHTQSAIAITSAEAMRALAGLDLSLHKATPLFAVGQKTAEAAHASGFIDIRVADGDGASLASLLREHDPKSVVYLTGRPRSPTLETALAAAGMAFTVVECYEMVPIAPPSADLRKLFDPAPTCLLFHSRETARLFFDLPAVASNTAAFGSTIIACLSARVAHSVPAELQLNVKIAARPDEESLLALL